MYTYVHLYVGVRKKNKLPARDSAATATSTTTTTTDNYYWLHCHNSLVDFIIYASNIVWRAWTETQRGRDRESQHVCDYATNDQTILNARVCSVRTEVERNDEGME